MKKFKSLIVLFILCCLFAVCSVNYLYPLANSEYVYLGGFTAGFTLKTRGATVVGITEVVSKNGCVSPCKCAGLEIGDIILTMNESEINTASDIDKVLKNYTSGVIVTEILRGNQKKLVDLFPEKDLLGNFKLGLFIRDDLTGLGTVTFITDEGIFASLGHPVSNEQGEIYNLKSGDVYESTIVGVNKASRGHAGELKGMFLGSKPIGKISINTSVGLFGSITKFNPLNYVKIPVGYAKIGKAEILSTVDGQNSKKYDIEIVKTDSRIGNNKNYVIKITDKELLEYTGGILQGMSGSPIIQEGKLVGAVTHVFINDSSRGYGISINNMLDMLSSLKK